ncbi:toll/interleukin-1 receptor domain-containing protein [Paractinoplanes toevensis]|uniref:TIR domain-containing protein n=1 Tax=Paractinoplanes toevensis TaxID=571911 RepID=A0A919THW2_9ACTN|nr:toll/interleukin-1 receptor domain-containing protein [Actinoplanes toevensis]GIM94675.1 hypothetical protein Ato02nite_064680 [Actinoplanes toevensis]
MNGYAFVSYSRKDDAYTRRLIDHIRRAGLQVWADSGLETGARWQNEIRAKVEGAAAMVVVVSPEAKKSTWVGNEVTLALEREIPVLPVLVVGTEYFGLLHAQHFDATKGQLPDQQFLNRLAAATGDPPPVVPRDTRAVFRRRRVVLAAAAGAVVLGGAAASAILIDRGSPDIYPGALLGEGNFGQLISTFGTPCVQVLGDSYGVGASVGRASCEPGWKQELVAIPTGKPTDWKLMFRTTYSGEQMCLAVTADGPLRDRKPVLDRCESAPAWGFDDWGPGKKSRYWHVHYSGLDGAYCLARPAPDDGKDTEPALRADNSLHLEECNKQDGWGQQWRIDDR